MSSAFAAACSSQISRCNGRLRAVSPGPAASSSARLPKRAGSQPARRWRGESGRQSPNEARAAEEPQRRPGGRSLQQDGGGRVQDGERVRQGMARSTSLMSEATAATCSGAEPMRVSRAARLMKKKASG